MASRNKLDMDYLCQTSSASDTLKVWTKKQQYVIANWIQIIGLLIMKQYNFTTGPRYILRIIIMCVIYKLSLWQYVLFKIK